MNYTRIFNTSFASIYKLYINKVERKGQTQQQVDAVIGWLTGYTTKGLQTQIEKQHSLEAFFAQAPQINPNASKITGSICGYKIDEIENELMKKIRYMDKLIDEVAKGKSMDKILRR